MSLLDRLDWKLSVFFALAIKLLALLPTPLLLRFFSAALLSEFCRPGGLPFPLRFSPLAAWSGSFGAPSGDEDVLESSEGPSDLEMGSVAAGVSDLAPEELELPPNILFSRPP
ncbi:hypothetical protein RRF57_007662 [Xylaria bambusicola]|uniref:Uncharacterized protein n=1 Tax=Xylaria bambusicola TaxID=326684 RepID=A0AAN7UN42_9PEZI